MRHITLLLENGTSSDLDFIKEWCNENNVEFKYRYSRDKARDREYEAENEIAPLYYFTILADTALYNRLQEEVREWLTKEERMGKTRLLTTDFADICNVADMGDEFEKDFSELIKLLKNSQSLELKANRHLLDFTQKIDNIELLKEMRKYSGYMSAHQTEMIDTRIEILSGNIEKIHEEFFHDILSVHNDVKALRAKTNMNRKQFSEYFGIPYRTVEDWENRKSTCATYLFKLMEEKLEKNAKIVK